MDFSFFIFDYAIQRSGCDWAQERICVYYIGPFWRQTKWKRSVSVWLPKNWWVWGDITVHFLRIRGPGIGIPFEPHFNRYAFLSWCYMWSAEGGKPLFCRQYPGMEGAKFRSLHKHLFFFVTVFLWAVSSLSSLSFLFFHIFEMGGKKSKEPYPTDLEIQHLGIHFFFFF